MPSPHLVEAIDRLDPVPYRGEAFRHLARRWHPLSGGGARIQGGRWNPPESFATLYLALQRPTEHLGREAIKAPSATGTGDVLAVFIDRLLPDSAVEPLDFETWESAPPD